MTFLESAICQGHVYTWQCNCGFPYHSSGHAKLNYSCKMGFFFSSSSSPVYYHIWAWESINNIIGPMSAHCVGVLWLSEVITDRRNGSLGYSMCVSKIISSPSINCSPLNVLLTHLISLILLSLSSSFSSSSFSSSSSSSSFSLHLCLASCQCGVDATRPSFTSEHC